MAGSMSVSKLARPVTGSLASLHGGRSGPCFPEVLLGERVKTNRRGAVTLELTGVWVPGAVHAAPTRRRRRSACRRRANTRP